MTAKELVLLLAGVILGGLASWLITRWYYVQSSKDLRAENAKLRQDMRVSMRGQEVASGMELFGKTESGDPSNLEKRGRSSTASPRYPDGDPRSSTARPHDPNAPVRSVDAAGSPKRR